MYDDSNIYGGDSENDQKNNHDSVGDWDHNSEVKGSENEKSWWNDEPNIKEYENNNIEGSEVGNDCDLNDIIQVDENVNTKRRNHNMGTQRNKRSIADGLPSANNGSGLNRDYWSQPGSHIYPMLAEIVVAEQAGMKMMKEYFEIEGSKSTSQYGFRKGLKLFGYKGYQAAKNKLKANLLGRGCIDMMSWKELT